MESCGNPGGAGERAVGRLAACSACAGDYEDPDRTAWRESIDDEDHGEAVNARETRRAGERPANERSSMRQAAIEEIAPRRNDASDTSDER